MSHPVNLSDRLTQCKTPQHALLFIAEVVDALEQRVADLEGRGEQPAADPWQQPLDWSGGIEIASHQDALKERWASDDIDDLTEQLRSTEDPDERRALKARLWLLKNPGVAGQGGRADAGQRVSVSGDVKELPVPDAGRMLVRRNLAKRYRLWEAFTPQRDEDEVVEAYAKGGPLWLYHSDNQLCLQLPTEFRLAMVADVQQDSVQEAREIGRDLLKAREGERMLLRGVEPSAEKPTYDELLERLEALEKTKLGLRDLPLAALQRKLEQDWHPSAALLLGDGSVTPEMLADKAATTRKVYLDTQHIEGTNVAFYNSHGGAGTVDLTQNGASGPMTLSYTPEVDAWWDLTICVGLIIKNDAAYHYLECFGQMTAGIVPAVGSAVGYAVGTAFMYAVHVGRSDVQTYTSFHVQRRVPLTAGVAYTFKARMNAQGGNWSYYQAPDRLYLQGKAWAR